MTTWNVLKGSQFAVVAFSLFMAVCGHAETLDGVVKKLEQVNTLRESLAGTLNANSGAINEQTFQAVCAPVGKELKTWSAETGVAAGQKSHRNRNINNAAMGGDLKAVEYFKRHPSTLYMIDELTREGKKGYQVFRRITVQSSCLYCHGVKSQRPDFIKTKYPKDLAYGFKVGDLRGVYSVWMPLEPSPASGK